MKQFIYAVLALAFAHHALAMDEMVEPYGTYAIINKSPTVEIYYDMGAHGEDLLSSSLCPKKVLASVDYEMDIKISQYRDKQGVFTMAIPVRQKDLQLMEIKGSHACFPEATYQKISDDITDMP